MIIIGGTGLETQELPFADVLTYMIENNESHFHMKLKSSAKSGRFSGVFVGPTMQGVEIPLELGPITRRFSSDEELVDMLEHPEGKQAPEIKAEVDVGSKVAKAVEGLPDAKDIKPEKIIDETVRSESIDEVTNSAFGLIKLTPEIDRGLNKVELRDRLIEQKNMRIAELQRTLDEAYLHHEKTLRDVADRYTDQVTLANDNIAKLEARIQELTLSIEESRLMNSFVHAKNHVSVQKGGITTSQAQMIQARNKKGSKLHIFAAGSGDSFYGMARSVKGYLDEVATAPVHVYDFTGDPFFVGRIGMTAKHNALEVAKGLSPHKAADVRETETGNKITWHLTGLFNDISLLIVDWADVLARVLEDADGADVFFIFNSVASFAVRETVSRLSIVGNLSIFVTCSGDSLYSLPAMLSFIPANRFTVVIPDFIDDLRPAVDQLALKFGVQAFSPAVKWDMLFAPEA